MLKLLVTITIVTHLCINILQLTILQARRTETNDKGPFSLSLLCSLGPACTHTHTHPSTKTQTQTNAGNNDTE